VWLELHFFWLHDLQNEAKILTLAIGALPGSELVTPMNSNEGRLEVRGRMPWCALLSRVIGIGIETAAPTAPAPRLCA
jgi:hypothetical protein